MAVLERISIPDELMDDKLRIIWDDQMSLIEKAINEINGVLRRRAIPERAREGQIYYLEEDIDDFGATEGYWVWLNDEWYRIDLTVASELPPTTGGDSEP
jgi:hypothetical protein